MELKIMKCPTCGAKLRYDNPGEPIVCMCCGNVYYPSEEKKNNQPTVAEGTTVQSGNVKVEGMKTPSSVLAYVEQYLDNYDWEEFLYNTKLSIDEIDAAIEGTKINSADNWMTWKSAILASVVPVCKKLEQLSKNKDTVVEMYRKGDFVHSSSYFYLFRSIELTLEAALDSVKAQNNKYLEYAKKYGAPDEELAELSKTVSSLDDIELNFSNYSSVEEIPEIKAIIDDYQKSVDEKFTSEGIDAVNIYKNAVEQFENKNYTSALNLFKSITDYKLTNDYVEKINRLSSVGDVFVFQDKFYFYEGRRLYVIENGEINGKVLSPFFDSVLGCYGSFVYVYSKDDSKIYKLVLNGADSTYSPVQMIGKVDSFKRLSGEFKIYITANYEGSNRIYALDLERGTVSSLISEFNQIKGFVDGVFMFSTKTETNNTLTYSTYIYDVRTNKQYKLSRNASKLVAVIDDTVYYTVDRDTSGNRYIISEKLTDGSCLNIIERNISGMPMIVDGRIYYSTVDNLNVQHLVSVNLDGSERCELFKYVNSILFKSGDWLYFTKRSRYNSAICKGNIVTGATRVIADEISEFVQSSNGYLYYLDFDNKLIEVRMDGSQKHTVCSRVSKVISIDTDRVIYESLDHKVTETVRDGRDMISREKDVISLYAIHFDEYGHRKAGYNIESSVKVDNSTIYFIGKNNVPGDNYRYLMALDLSDYSVKQIARLSKTKVETVRNNGLISIVLGAIALFVAVIIFTSGMSGYTMPDYGLGTYLYIGTNYPALLASLIPLPIGVVGLVFGLKQKRSKLSYIGLALSGLALLFVLLSFIFYIAFVSNGGYLV